MTIDKTTKKGKVEIKETNKIAEKEWRNHLTQLFNGPNEEDLHIEPYIRQHI